MSGQDGGGTEPGLTVSESRSGRMGNKESARNTDS